MTFVEIKELLNPSLFWEYRTTLLYGLIQTVLVFISSAALASVLAIGVGLARFSSFKPVRWIAVGYAELFRNTPEYILLVWVYYIFPTILGALFHMRFGLSPFLAAVLALGIAYSGFLSETVRAGIQSVPSGHVEAALALGLPKKHILWRIIAPQALCRMLPEGLNQYISLFKATSIVSLIAVEDLMYRVSMINIEQMKPLPLYTGIALLYCAVIIVTSQLIQRLSNKWRQKGWA